MSQCRLDESFRNTTTGPRARVNMYFAYEYAECRKTCTYAWNAVRIVCTARRCNKTERCTRIVLRRFDELSGFDKYRVRAAAKRNGNISIFSDARKTSRSKMSIFLCWEAGEIICWSFSLPPTPHSHNNITTFRVSECQENISHNELPFSWTRREFV